MYYVYILKGKNDVYYKGLTDNIDRRYKQHITGKSPTTKKYLPLELVFVQICSTCTEARELERYLKSGTGREIIDEIV